MARPGLIQLYTVNGTRYACFSSWKDHQRINRPTPSKLPAPPPFTSSSMSRHGAITEPSVKTHAGSEGIGGEGKGSEGSGGECRGEPEGALRSALAAPSAAAPLRAPDSSEGAGDLEHIAPELRAVIERAGAAVVAAKKGAAPVEVTVRRDANPLGPGPPRRPSERIRCAGMTRANLECALRPVPGSAFCRRHSGS